MAPYLSNQVGCAVGAARIAPPGVYVCMSGEVFPHDRCARDPKTGRFVDIKTPGAEAGDDPGIILPCSE